MNENVKNDVEEDLQEKQLLEKINSVLSCDVVNIIYGYLNGKAKFICHRKFELLETNIKQDFYKGYPYWKYIKNIFDSMSSTQFMTFILQGPIKNYPSIIQRVWYLSKDTGILYDGQHLIDLWSKQKEDNNFNLEYYTIVEYNIRERIVESIYNYMLRNINRFEREKMIQNICCLDNYNKNNNKVFTLIENTFKLYKSLEYMDGKMKIYGWY